MDTPMGNAYGQHHSRYPSGHESSSVSSVGSKQTVLPPVSALHPPNPSRTLPEPSFPPSTVTKSPVGYGGSDFRYHPYAASSGSPSSVGGSMPEPVDQYAPTGVSPTHMTGPGLGGPQKRAYRQRRKDPSCDACRERKVKCDATETSSCSECSTRNVKCQFTKETNRRMSSIKQVQDLQTQLADAKQQINQLRTMLDATHQAAGGPQQLSLHLPPLEQRSRRAQEPYFPPVPGLDPVRENLRKYSRGVFKMPPPHRHMMPTPLIATSEPALPPPEVSDALLAIYHDHIQRKAPMIHWPSFIAQYEKVRVAGNFIGQPQIWTALFFSVLACGTLQAGSPVSFDEGMRYVVITARLLNTWTDNLLPDHARTSMLISVFLYEANIRSAGWVWHGTAIRMAQEIGLQCLKGPWSRIEAEGRLRTYWAIVSWDRLLSLQENLPHQMPIDADDERWPRPVDDYWLQPRGDLPPPENAPGLSSVDIVMPVIRLIGQLKKSLRAKTITPDVYRTYDEYFRMLQSQLPEQLQHHSESWLEPFTFSSVVPLLMVRFQLYRHNMNVFASPQERAEAIDRCAAVSHETVRYILRTMQMPPPSPYQASMAQPQKTWQQMLDAIAHNLLSRHIWRCTLILCLKGDFEAASTCVHLSKSIGEARKLNIACGRNLAFFLDRLIERTAAGMAQHEIESNLELIAYASGDLQGDADAGLVWTGVQTRPTDNPFPGPQNNVNSATSQPSFDDSEDLPASALLTEKEMKDWGGWERVERQIARLIEEQERRRHSKQPSPFQPPPPGPLYHRPAHNETKRVQLSSVSESMSMSPTPGAAPTGPGASPKRGSSPPSGASRISIANII